MIGHRRRYRRKKSPSLVLHQHFNSGLACLIASLIEPPPHGGSSSAFQITRAWQGGNLVPAGDLHVRCDRESIAHFKRQSLSPDHELGHRSRLLDEITGIGQQEGIVRKGFAGTRFVPLLQRIERAQQYVVLCVAAEAKELLGADEDILSRN